MKAEDCVILIKIVFTILALSFKESSGLFSHQSNNKIWDRLYQKLKYCSWPGERPYKLFFFFSLHRKCVVVIKSRIQLPLSIPPSNLPPHRKNRTSGNWACWKNCSTGSYQYKENFTSSWTTPTRLESLPYLRWIWKRQESKAKEFFFRTLYQWICNVELSAHSSQISESLYQSKKKKKLIV